WTFHSDNTVERKHHYIFKVLDQSAIQSWSSVQERWEPWHQERPLFRARVITSDGIAHDLDPKTLVDAPAGSNSPQSYSDLRVLQGPLPAVAAGAIVESELTEHFTPLLGSMAFRGYVAWNVPVRFSRLTAVYPESLPFRYTADLCPDLKAAKETRDGIVHLTLSFGAFDSIKESDPLLPFEVPRAPSVTISTGAPWNDLAVQYGKVIDRQIADAPVKNLVGKALNGEKDRSAIIQKLVSTLHSEVRYTGIEFADAAIIPAKPAETLSRKYGDCKDKASLLVAMLRAAGAPSYVAILNAGFEQDVAPQHPGMGMFNHAIVYVPGSPELWIDATAEHSRAGSLPPPDEGRLALVIRPETKELIKIPESVSSDNAMITVLDYYLPDFGPSHVVESSGGAGAFDSTYRDLVALLDNEEVRKSAEKQTQAQWDTKAEIKISHPPANDFSKPFQITTDVPDTKTLNVSETGATLTLPVVNVFSGLPQVFTTDDAENTDPTGKKKLRTQGFVLPAAFVNRVSCRIHIPVGLALKKVPEDQTVKLGPATYRAHYVLKDQVLTAEIWFDSAKRNYTLDEGNALKKAAIEFLKKPAPVLNFEPFGQTLLEEGQLREGLDAFRGLATQQSGQAVNHVRLSRAYLATGCGQEARNEAKIANQMAPDLAVTWRNLAFIHEHDLIGRKYKQGWDPTVVETSLRKAMSLDPDDFSARTELAESFSYDARGNQFQSMERLAKAIELFDIMGDDKVEQLGAQDTMIYDLAVLGNLDKLRSKLDRFGSNGSRAGYRLFLTAVRESGAKAAADLQASASGEDVKQAFWSAANLLARTGRYQLEADLATGLGFESQLFVPAANLRNVRRIDPQNLHPDSPDDLVRCFLAAQFDPGENADSLARFWSASLQPRLHIFLQRWQRSALSGISQHGVLPAIARDVYLSSATAATDTNGTSGFRVRVTMAGRTSAMLVVHEQSGFKLLGNSQFAAGAAQQALINLQAGNQETARKWLDWLREDIKIHSEDDPLGGPVFPRIWHKGAAVSAAQIRYAAASLLFSKQALPILKKAIDSAPESGAKAYYQLAYARVCVYVKSWSDCVPVAKSLAAGYPASDSALEVLSQAYAGAGQAQEAEKTLKRAIANNPDDLALKRALVNTLALDNRMKDAAQAAKETAEAPDSSPIDWNQYGWISLVAGDTDEQKIHAVERAQNQPNIAVANTIASMYAEIGKLNEARQISLQSLEKFGYEAPDSSWWYVFGRIAEQLAAKSSAVFYYEKAELDPNDPDSLSVHSLARKRLAALNSFASHGS
ncbi:MAG TPA: DUF3857 domain-containing protein, partial [Bryobacteraceae bacterium]